MYIITSKTAPAIRLDRESGRIFDRYAATDSSSTPELHTAFGFESVNYGFAYIALGIALAIVQPFVSMLTSAYSRHAEYRADRQAVKEGYGEALVSSLKTLAKENFSNLSPSRALVVLEYSHPPLSERIAAIEKEIEKNI